MGYDTTCILGGTHLCEDNCVATNMGIGQFSSDPHEVDTKHMAINVLTHSFSPPIQFSCIYRLSSYNSLSPLGA